MIQWSLDDNGFISALSLLEAGRKDSKQMPQIKLIYEDFLSKLCLILDNANGFH
jgi:hypothetical protein